MLKFLMIPDMSDMDAQKYLMYLSKMYFDDSSAARK